MAGSGAGSIHEGPDSVGSGLESADAEGLPFGNADPAILEGGLIGKIVTRGNQVDPAGHTAAVGNRAGNRCCPAVIHQASQGNRGQ